MSHSPLVLTRPGGSKVVGCLVYLVVAPFAALFLALIPSVLIMVPLYWMGKTSDSAGAVFVTLLPLTTLWAGFWGYREFRRRAGLKVVVDRDHVIIAEGRSTVEVPFTDVCSIRLKPTRDDFACVLLLRGGRPVRLPPEVAPFALTREALETALIPRLVRQLDERLARGEAVELVIPRFRRLGIALRALGSFVAGTFMLLNPLLIPLGLLILRHAMVVSGQARLGLQGGLVLKRDGVSHPACAGSEGPVPWDSLERTRSDPIGFVLRAAAGREFAMSSLTENYWPAVRWINARLEQRKGTRSLESP